MTARRDLIPAWMDHAECSGVDPDLFFPGRGDDVTLRKAKAVCSRCPVKDECLDHALAHGEKWGVWGGTSERERRQLRRAMKVVGS
jgi:WhiB family redox-sensing transcriptional regulator